MPIDWGELGRQAENQADLLTRAQCLGAGAGDELIAWRVSSGRWVRIHSGVYLTKPGRADWLVRGVAALLRLLSTAQAADAALRGSSAAYLWGLEARPPATVELVVPASRYVTAPEGVTITRSRHFDRLVDDRAYPWRTTVAATVLDLADQSRATDALSVVARSVQREAVNVGELRRELAARARHRHRRLLDVALADVDEGGQSGAELLYIRDVESAHGLPRGARQAPSDEGQRRYHDTCYEEFGLVVEVDGRLGHERWSDRVRDGRRDRQLLTTAHVTTRVFWPDVALTPCKTAIEVGAILSGRGWPGRLKPCRRPGCPVGPST